MNATERALLKACHYALIQLRSRAYDRSATLEEVAEVTDALELVIIELWSGRATDNHLLLESVLAGISKKCEAYGGAALFALEPAAELVRQRALFAQSLDASFGPLPDWAQDCINQAGDEDLERYRDQFMAVLTEKSGGLEQVLR